MSVIIGNGYCLRLMTLFNWRKLLIQRTLPSFFGIMNEGDALGPVHCDLVGGQFGGLELHDMVNGLEQDVARLPCVGSVTRQASVDKMY
jgi:hypothetical protein